MLQGLYYQVTISYHSNNYHFTTFSNTIIRKKDDVTGIKGNNPLKESIGKQVLETVQNNSSIVES